MISGRDSENAVNCRRCQFTCSSARPR